MRWVVIGVIVLVLLAAAGVLVAQQSSLPAGGEAGVTQTLEGLQIDSQALVGSPVRGEGGTDIGKVANLMIDAKDGKVAAVVLTMGRTYNVGGTALTFGGKDITVPWAAVKVGRDREKVVIMLMDGAGVPKAEGSARAPVTR